MSTSKHDNKFLSEAKNSKRIIRKFFWNDSSNNKNIITVHVCHDFIENICKTIDSNTAGLYIVVMCSPKIDEFYGLSSVVMRAIDGYKSNVVVLCNSSDNPPNKNDVSKVGACGETQIVGPYDGQLPKIGRFSEGGIVAKVQLSSLITKPTRIERTNAIDDIFTFSINEKGYIRECEDNIRSGKIVINPNAILEILGLQKIYSLFCMKSYSKMLDTFKYLPLQCNGVFGIYDVLIKSYEEDLDFFEKRLISYLGEKYNDLRDPDLPQRKIYTVTYVMKYRGKQLCNIVDGIIKSNPDFKELETHYIENNIIAIKNKIRGKEIHQEKEKELFDQFIFLKVKCDSDIYPDEKDFGLEEYLIFIDIYPSGEKSNRLVNREFRKNILPILVSDEKIRTVELCGHSNGEDTFDGSYIIHLVGTLSDVRNVILNYIHTQATSIDIRCRTFVVPAAESLSYDKHVYLDETIIRSPQLKSFVIEMLYYLKFVDPTNPFIIKQVPIDLIRNLADVYSSYKKFLKGDPRRNELLSKFNGFVYGICFGCLDNDFLNFGTFSNRSLKNSQISL